MNHQIHSTVHKQVLSKANFNYFRLYSQAKLKVTALLVSFFSLFEAIQVKGPLSFLDMGLMMRLEYGRESFIVM